MLILVSGGAASGKSEYAESLIVRAGHEKRTYIATMEIFDAEGERRAARHRAMRAGKGFTTLECPRGLMEAALPSGGSALLECMSNLVANEMFRADGIVPGEQGLTERVCLGVLRLAAQTELTVIVTNELFSDGIRYAPETERYLAALSALNNALAAQADAVVEVVCGIPIYWKGKELL